MSKLGVTQSSAKSLPNRSASLRPSRPHRSPGYHPPRPGGCRASSSLGSQPHSCPQGPFLEPKTAQPLLFPQLRDITNIQRSAENLVLHPLKINCQANACVTIRQETEPQRLQLAPPPAHPPLPQEISDSPDSGDHHCLEFSLDLKAASFSFACFWILYLCVWLHPFNLVQQDESML